MSKLQTTSEGRITELEQELKELRTELKAVSQQNKVLSAGVDADSARPEVAAAAIQASESVLSDIDAEIEDVKRAMNRQGPANSLMARLYNLQKQRKDEQRRLDTFAPAKPVAAAKLISDAERRRLDELTAAERSAQRELQASGGRGMSVVHWKRCHDARKRFERELYGRSSAGEVA